MFEKECVLLPGIDFKVLWSENITEKTKQVIWKYLKLLVLTTVGSMPGGENESKMFQDMNDEELRAKLEEATKDIDDFFKDMPIPNPETLKDHITGMMTGKLGKLAREIADETVGTATPETMQDMLKDPSKMLGLVNTVGTKIDSKIKSGELKESELIEEASEMLKKMKSFGEVLHTSPPQRPGPQRSGSHEHMFEPAVHDPQLIDRPQQPFEP